MSNDDEQMQALMASLPVLTPEELARVRAEEAAAAERARIARGGGDIDWQRDVNVRKWSDQVGLRVVDPAPDDDDDETARP